MRLVWGVPISMKCQRQCGDVARSPSFLVRCSRDMAMRRPTTTTSSPVFGLITWIRMLSRVRPESTGTRAFAASRTGLNARRAAFASVLAASSAPSASSWSFSAFAPVNLQVRDLHGASPTSSSAVITSSSPSAS
jgi:hypothetical protein